MRIRCRSGHTGHLETAGRQECLSARGGPVVTVPLRRPDTVKGYGTARKFPPLYRQPPAAFCTPIRSTSGSCRSFRTSLESLIREWFPIRPAARDRAAYGDGCRLTRLAEGLVSGIQSLAFRRGSASALFRGGSCGSRGRESGAPRMGTSRLGSRPTFVQ
jgi:hypothetical protein